MPEAVLIFIAPPDPAALRERLRGDAARTPPRRSRSGSRPPRGSSSAQDEFPHVVVNDEVQKAASEAGEARPRPSYPYTDRRMIKPRVDKLLEQTDSHYAAVIVVAAKRARQINAYYHSLSEGAYGEYTPPMVETGSGNYLTIALEETAAGKLKYEYKD